MNTLVQIQTKPPNDPEQIATERREFLRKCLMASPFLVGIVRVAAQQTGGNGDGVYHPEDHYYGMGVDVSKCIGCGLCKLACDRQQAIRMEPVPEYRLPYKSWYSMLLRTTPGMLRTSWKVWRSR